MNYKQIISVIKPKFHYADFTTFTKTSPRGKSRAQITKVRDTNHVADFRDLCRGLCRRLSPCTVHDPLEQHKRVSHRLLMYFVANISTCRDGLCPRLSWSVSTPFTKTSWFHDLSLFESTTFMICVRNFPRGEVSMKVDVMEFELYKMVSYRLAVLHDNELIVYLRMMNWIY